MADASLIGRTFPTFHFPVEEGKVREFSQAVHWSDGTQTAPTFSTASSFWTPPDTGSELDIDLSRVLAGGNEWEYLGPVHVGDVLTVHTSITNVEKKQGKRGEMTIITREMRFVNQHGDDVQIQRSFIIEMPPLASDEEARA